MQSRVIMFCTCCESHLEFSEATLNGTSRYFVYLYSAVISYFGLSCREEQSRRNHPSRGRQFASSVARTLGALDDTANKCKRSKLIWVVVNDEDYDEEVHTKVWQTSIRESLKQPETWAEAAVQQHPEIEAAVIEVARLFATCPIADEIAVMEID